MWHLAAGSLQSQSFKEIMDCGQTQSLFTAYHDGELDQRNLLLVEHHLAACGHCGREWQDFQKTLQLLHEVKPLPVPQDLLPGIHEKLAGGGLGARLERILQKLFAPVPLTAAASLTAAIFVALFLIKPHIGFTPETQVLAPSARIAQVNQPERLEPPLVTMPVSLGRPTADLFNYAPQIPGSERTSYYRSVLEHEGIDFSLLAPSGYRISVGESQIAEDAPKWWQIGRPLVPDVTIRMHHLSPAEMKWLHNRIKKEGRWQTRLYSQDYFLVVVDPGELSTLYNLLQRQHLLFFSQSFPETGQAVQRPLLVAVRPR
jgi:hypothetical protein